jgi:hypothetical protein
MVRRRSCKASIDNVDVFVVGPYGEKQPVMVTALSNNSSGRRLCYWFQSRPELWQATEVSRINSMRLRTLNFANNEDT